MWFDGGGVVNKLSHEEETWWQCYPYEGGGHWGGITNHLCVVLHLGDGDGKMPGDRLSGSSAYRGTAKEAFHVSTFLSRVAVVQEGRDPLPCSDL